MESESGTSLKLKGSSGSSKDVAFGEKRHRFCLLVKPKWRRVGCGFRIRVLARKKGLIRLKAVQFMENLGGFTSLLAAASRLLFLLLLQPPTVRRVIFHIIFNRQMVGPILKETYMVNIGDRVYLRNSWGLPMQSNEELSLTLSLNSLLLCKFFNLLRVNKIKK